MVTVKMDDVAEVEIVEGSHVFTSKGDRFQEWDEIPGETQKKILELRDSIKISLQGLVDCLAQ